MIPDKVLESKPYVDVYAPRDYGFFDADSWYVGAAANAGPRQIFALKDFVSGVEAEANRRLGVLFLLCNHRDYAGRTQRPANSLRQ